MIAITNTSSPAPTFYDLINYILTDPIFNELTPDSIQNIESQKNQEGPFESLKRKIDHLNQPIAKQAFVLNSSSSSPENSVIMSSRFKRKLIDTINQIYKKANALSLEKAQIHYANRLNIDLQEIKNIYVTVANESSVIETKTSNRSITIDPELKNNLVKAINRNLDKVKPFNLEKIQTYYANQLKIDLQEIKNIYLAAHRPTIITKTSSSKKLDVLDLNIKNSYVDAIIISPETKKNLVRNINYLFCATDASLEEIQTRYANQLKVDLQEIKKIYFAISTNCPSANETSEIKQRNSMI